MKYSNYSNPELKIITFISLSTLSFLVYGMENKITLFQTKFQKNRNNVQKLEKYWNELVLLKNFSPDIDHFFLEVNNRLLYLQTKKQLNYIEQMPARYEKNSLNALEKIKTTLDNIFSTRLGLNQQELQHVDRILIPHAMQLINAERFFLSKKPLKDLIPLHEEEYQNDLKSFYSLKRNAFDGRTILQHAILCKFPLAAINYLLSLGQNTNDTNNDGENALHTATAKGSNLKILKLLLSYKPPLYTENSFYPYLYAKPNIDMQNIFGQTPLHIACKRKLNNIIKLLLDYNASVVIDDNNNKKPVDYLFEQSWTLESTSICKDLLAIYEPEKLSTFLTHQHILHAIKQRLEPLPDPIKKQRLQKKYTTFIFEALEKGFLVKSIVMNNQTILNKPNHKGETPLCWALAHNKLKFCKLLLKHNASPKFRSNVALSENDIVMLTPLEHILLVQPSFQQKILNLLLQYKANQNLCIMKPPLHQMIDLDNSQGIITLLNNNADINMKNFLDSTALHYACENSNNSNNSIITLLIVNGADPNIINKNNKAALDYCYENKNSLLILLLLAFGATTFQKKIFIDNIEIKNFNIMQKLIKINRQTIDKYNKKDIQISEDTKVIFDKKGIYIFLPKVKFKV